MSLIPGQGTKTLHAIGYSQKNKNKFKKSKLNRLSCKEGKSLIFQLPVSLPRYNPS